MPPKLIVFSGIDSSGKSTQVDLLVNALEEQVEKVCMLWSRGGYTGGMEALKSFVRRLTGERVIPAPGHSQNRERALRISLIGKLWLSLGILDMMRLYGFVVRWHCALGRTVIMDRYLEDTRIDFSLNFPNVAVERWGLWKLLERLAPKPDAVICIFIPLEESIRRSEQKNEPFSEGMERRRERLVVYERIAKEEGWHRIDGLQSVQDVFKSVADTLQLDTTGAEV